ncbi:isochorismatase family protein [Gordonia defluvii]|uniref:nicotinamidase n=1 Tax=Gordonia defluvii TaxID=283718 RepID=A0ABP6LC36_9ACTN|nr:isochorismatase family protein [Gordonia sp. UBA5067]
MRSNALIVVDVQYDFCEGGSLAVVGGLGMASRLAAALRDEAFVGRYDVLVTTQDWHIDPGAHFAAAGQVPDFQTSWPVHCVAGSDGARIIAELDDAVAGIETIPVIRVFKGHYSAAYSGFEGVTGDDERLLDRLRSDGVTDVDIAGIATDYCVKQTAIHAADAGFGTTVLQDFAVGIDDADVAALYASGFAAAGVSVRHR